ncbi:MAG: hypothetical protein MJ082_02820 [Clostridia bacterium]|nr:hypothetical protein [Clostridia bacterium]
MERTYAVPVARCPYCRHTILYAKEASVRSRVTVFAPPEDYRNYTVLCAKCKKMIGLRELPERPSEMRK